ncbi:MAG: Ig-like domain-containing protein [Eubacterium sp.]|nr:Ig-like domain-containing protein [Eubacterium sp.]
MKKTKGLAIVCSAVLVLTSTLSGVQVRADKEGNKFPFELQAPKYTAVSLLGTDSNTSMSYAYSMEEDMCSFLAKQDTDNNAYLAELKECGYDELWVNLQMDWAIDDPTDWKYTTYWDTDGMDNDYNYRVDPWSVLDERVYPKTVNEFWCLRGFNSSEWNGDGVTPGLKSVLKTGQYQVVDTDEGGVCAINIDWSQHTLYVRSRYRVTTIKEGQDAQYTFSEWSNVSSYGKNANSIPTYNKSMVNPPEVSNLRISSDEDYNGAPVAYVTLSVPNALRKASVDLEVNGGTIRLEMEGRVQGTTAWKGIGGEFEIKSGDMWIPLIYLQEEKQIHAGTPIELRFRYWCKQNELWNGEELTNFYTDYSKILKINTPEIPGVNHGTGTGDNSGKTNPKDEGNISSANVGASKNQVSKFVTNLKNDNDPKGTSFSFLLGKQKKAKKNAITLTWKKAKNASYYMVYGAKCGKKNHYAPIQTVKTNSFTQKGLTKGTYYKYLIAAFDKNDKLLGMSNTIHVATKGGKVCNYKKVTSAAKKSKVKLKKKGATFKLKGKGIKESKKLKVNVHRKIRYESENKAIATVDQSGKIKAKKKGKCTIYVYAQNGAYQKVTVTVEK